jgi:hemolysin D
MPLSPRSSRTATNALAHRDDPALPVILEFLSPSAAVLTAPVPRGARHITWIVSSMFLACLLATGIIPVDQVVVMQGKVVPAVPTQVVQPLDTAIVRSIHARVGDKVRKGQLLATLEVAPVNPVDLAATRTDVANFAAQYARLKAEAENQPFTYTGDDPYMHQQLATYQQRQAQYASQIENHTRQIDGLVALIARSESDAKGYRERLTVAANLANMREELERRHVGSRVNTLAAVDNRAEMARNLTNSLQTADNAKANLAAEMAQRDAYVQQWHADINDQLAQVTSRLSDATGQLRTAELHQKLVDLRAGQDGTVLTVAQVSVGSVVQSGQPFFTLMPADAPLEVEGIIPASDGGFARVGDPVTIKFDTFQYFYYGVAYGTVRSIGANSFFGTDQLANQAAPVPIPNQSSQAYYDAKVSIERVALRHLPADVQIAPGMTVEADVKVGKRTVLSYFFSRIAGGMGNAMQEPGL